VLKVTWETCKYQECDREMFGRSDYKRGTVRENILSGKIVDYCRRYIVIQILVLPFLKSS